MCTTIISPSLSISCTQFRDSTFSCLYYSILVYVNFQVISRENLFFHILIFSLFNKISFTYLFIEFKQSVISGLLLIRCNFRLIWLRFFYAWLNWYCNAYVDVKNEYLKLSLSLKTRSLIDFSEILSFAGFC